ncbi:hypothetical protein RDABS01_039427 [Bienertia sinuspersici]
MGSTLNDDHRSMLDCSFTDKEIRQAIFSIPSNKAPGLDGYNSCFFKEAWSVVGQDVIRAIREFFSSGKLLKEVSVTTLTMVPKVQTPSNVGDYRPVACCSTIYKCISKLLCSKLSTILPDIISPEPRGICHRQKHNAQRSYLSGHDEILSSQSDTGLLHVQARC